MFLTIFIWGKLFGGTVPPNNTLFGGTVPPNSTLFGGTPNSDKERNQQFQFFLKKTFWSSDDGLLLEPSKNYVFPNSNH